MYFLEKKKQEKILKHNRRTLKIIIPVTIILIAYLILDYVNIPSHIGLMSSNINIDVLGILFDTAIVLILYSISFYYIENKQNEKDANARDAVSILLKKTYQECWNNLKLVDNTEMIEKYIIPKIDGSKTDSENKVLNNLQTSPFSSFNVVIDLAVNGYVEKTKLNDYLDIKKEYQYLISVKITFFDLTNPQTKEQQALYNDIQKRDSDLKKKLNELLNE